MISLKKMFFYGMTLVSLNLLSCNKESLTEVVEETDYLAPLIGTWQMLEQNNQHVPYDVKKIFSRNNSYTFSVEDTINHSFRSFRASIYEINESKYKAEIKEQYGEWHVNAIGRLEEWNYRIIGNQLYEDGNEELYNVYIKK
ncbi:hypothetical protein J4213_03535 [Candidatus Woesearchaeota archaeon]|nr:hypothetical protein [Candidatus Woesearchaeota archaeon]